MTESDQIPGRGVGVDGYLDGPGAVGGRDTRGNSLPGFDGEGEGGFEAALILGCHELQSKLVTATAGQSEANEAPPLLGHEVDRLGGGELGGHGQVALVLPALVVTDDDHSPGADVLDGLRDGGK